MFDVSIEGIQTLGLLIPALPLAGAISCALLGCFHFGKWAPVAAGSGVLGGFMTALAVALSVSHAHEPITGTYGTWFSIGNDAVGWEFRIDALAGAMTAMVTFISLWIVIFSAGYMHDDPGEGRYFALVSLFVAAMAVLILAGNLFVLFLGWEGVGVCSYLLVGYWYAKPEAAAAARKAFLVTRLGDIALLGAMILLGCHLGTLNLAYEKVFSSPLDPQVVFFSLVLLLIGAVGKSAQFPLHVWLPDAMEGPTPVSALIHAATMVTAGVYLLARFFPGMTGTSMDVPRLEAVASVQDIAGGLGAATAFLAAVMAVGQWDLKRVLAYSTLSQLGYMFMALAVSGDVRDEHTPLEVSSMAAFAAIFHLLTHAFFKALLFLSSGSVMHAMGHVIDMRKFSGLAKILPITHGCFLIGALALAGVPPLSGFFSKDEILIVLYEGGHSDSQRSAYFSILFWIALFTAFLTAYYTFRAYFLTFQGQLKIPREAGDHAHESPAVMTVPLVVLAACALLVGLLLGPTGSLHHFLEGTANWKLHESTFQISQPMILGTVAALTGIGLAWLLFSRRDRLSKPLGALETAAEARLYIDDIYLAVFVRPLATAGRAMGWFDRDLFQPLVELLATIPRMIGGRFRSVQNGLIQFYALAMALGLIVILAMFTVAR